MVDAIRKASAQRAGKASARSAASMTAVAPLRERIPRLLPGQAQALRDFFATPQYWTLRDGGTLYFTPGTPGSPRATFALEGDGVPLALDLEADDFMLAQGGLAQGGLAQGGLAQGGLAGGLHWSDYEGRSRMLAWSLAHESQLMRLSDGLGVALVPIELAADNDLDGQLWLDFAIDDADIDASAPASHRGKLRLPYAWLPRLLDRADQPYVDDPLPALGAWRGLPAPVAIRLAGPDLDIAQWRALRPGDVIVAGTRSRPPSVSAHAAGERTAGSAWSLTAVPQGWRVDGPARFIPSAPRESPAMSDSNASISGTAPAAGTDEDAGARNLPVKVEFEIGRIEMSVGELSTLQPGYVFALPAHLEGANVTIRANGRVSGRGEVVAVGETLGVRLLSWS